MALSQILVGPQTVTDGQIATARGSKSGEVIVTELHGKYYEACLRGQVFMSSTIIAGKAIPFAAATLAATGLTLHNPAGSGKIIELISCSIGLDSATVIVNTVGLMIQRNLTGTSGIPTSTTAAYVASLGTNGVNAASVYTVATLTNVAVPGVTAATAVPIPLYPMFTFGATAITNMADMTHNFDGRLILGPDSLVSQCTTVTGGQTAAFTSLIWAEWPI